MCLTCVGSSLASLSSCFPSRWKTIIPATSSSLLQAPRGPAVGSSAGLPCLAACGRLRGQPGSISSQFAEFSYLSSRSRSPCEMAFHRTPLSSAAAPHEVALMQGGGRGAKALAQATFGDGDVLVGAAARPAAGGTCGTRGRFCRGGWQPVPRTVTGKPRLSAAAPREVKSLTVCGRSRGSLGLGAGSCREAVRPTQSSLSTPRRCPSTSKGVGEQSL